MGMGAAKPGSTLPPQGGKGGGRPMPPQVPAQGGKAPPPLEAIYDPPQPGGGYPPMQPPGLQVIGYGSPPQGKALPDYNIYGPANPPSNTGIVPAQGGKGQDFGPNVFPGPKITYGSVQEQNEASARDRAAKGMVGFEGPNFTGQPAQVPAQGGKTPFTPEQQAAFGPYINTRPMPQVLPPQGGFPQQPQVPAQVQPMPQVMPRPAMTRSVMPRPAMPRPTMTRPSLIGSGLAGLRDRRGRR